MRTSKHLSAIAYHSPAVFERVTNDLRKSGAIGPALWVAHRGEGGDKPHIHLVLIGGFKTYNTDGLSSLWGFDLIDGAAASVSKLWRTTKNLSDWLLYGIHDPKYLAFKCDEREASYTWDDVKCTEGDEEIRAELIQEARQFLDRIGDKTTRRLIYFARQGKSWSEVVMSGIVPTGQFIQAQRAWAVIVNSIYGEGGK